MPAEGLLVAVPGTEGATIRMRPRRELPFGGIGLGVLSALILCGCGATQTIVKTVTAAPAASAPAPSSPAAASSAPSGGQTSSSATASTDGDGSQQAKVGDSLTLTGNGGESLLVTVDGVMDPLQVGEDDEADAGQRFVGVQITLKNSGSVAYSDSPSNGATLLSDSNEQAQSQIVSGGPCGNDFQSSVKLAPGDSQQGCVPFEMVEGQTPATFQFTLDSGFANQTGQWSLAGAVATSSSPVATSSVTQASAASSAQPPASGTGALSALESYWQSISSHQFGDAYADLAPGSVNVPKSQFVAQEDKAGITNAAFSGHVSAHTGSAATVAVDSLTTTDHQFGCRVWSGSYQLTNESGQWMIARANITPSPCGGG